jgi:hypothetical protein
MGGSAGSGAALGTGGDSITTGTARQGCDSVAAFPANVVPVCTYTGGQNYETGCPKAHVTVFGDGTNYYLASNNGQRIVGCPVGAIDSGLLEPDVTDDVQSREGRQDVLYYQKMTHGLIAFMCDELDNFGPTWHYRYICSPTGVQILESDPKGGGLFVFFAGPGAGYGSAGYVGAIPASSCSDNCRACRITFSSRTADGEISTSGAGDLGDHPITCSDGNQTFTFNDLDGLPLSIQVSPKSNQVVDVRR